MIERNPVVASMRVPAQIRMGYCESSDVRENRTKEFKQSNFKVGNDKLDYLTLNMRSYDTLPGMKENTSVNDFDKLKLDKHNTTSKPHFTVKLKQNEGLAEPTGKSVTHAFHDKKES